MIIRYSEIRIYLQNFRGVYMNCPYCNKIMTKGFINIPMETFHFYPEDVKPKLLRTRWSVNPRAVLIKEFSFAKALKRVYEYPACYCPTCKKIILEVENSL